jgi:hypothetical protein
MLRALSTAVDLNSLGKHYARQSDRTVLHSADAASQLQPCSTCMLGS